MRPFWRKRNGSGPPCAETVQTAGRQFESFRELERRVDLGAGEHRLYATLRQAVPLISAALEKIERLVGSFTVQCSDPAVERELNQFLREVRVNAGQQGIQSFLIGYLDQLLVFGTAVGELVPAMDGRSVAALYNARLDDLELRLGDNPLEIQICRREPDGSTAPVEYPDLVLFTALNPEPGRAQGVSLLRGLPFISGILLKIYNTIGLNWERVGNVRFAVTYKPSGDTDRAYAKERAQQIASEWGRAMNGSGPVSDFVSVGDVDIKVIGADNQILDSQVPVRQLLEQIVAKLGVPPFLLGLNWSSTERMSSQQADLLTSELEDYRRLLEPPIQKICGLWLRMNGYPAVFTVEWNNISLQDEVDLAEARLRNAQAAQVEQGLQNGGAT